MARDSAFNTGSIHHEKLGQLAIDLDFYSSFNNHHDDRNNGGNTGVRQRNISESLTSMKASLIGTATMMETLYRAQYFRISLFYEGFSHWNRNNDGNTV